MTSISTADAARVDGELDGDARERQRMAERDQLGGALGRLDRRDARDAEHVAFLRAAAANERQRRGLHRDPAAGARDAPRHALSRDVDHVRLTRRVEMGKMRLCAVPAERRAPGSAALRAAAAGLVVVPARRATSLSLMNFGLPEAS